jgi:tetratricopeptide (TPR) repeat protein
MKTTTLISCHSSGVAYCTGPVARRLLPLVIGLLFPLAALAQSDAAASAVLELHRQGQYEGAATRGLNELLVKPWNHQLRFVVADSLQRVGRVDEAIAQLEALEGTPYAETARTRLQALRASRRAAPQAGMTAPLPQVAPPAAAVTPQAPLPAAPQVYQQPAPIYQPSPQVAQAAQAAPRPAQPLPTPPSPVAATAPAAPSASVAAAPVARGRSVLPYVPSPHISQAPYISPSGAAVVDPRPAAPKATDAKPQSGEPARSPAAQLVADLNKEEKYYEVGTEGLALLAKEKPDDELKLMIANSLAWTGRYKEAQGVYQSLLAGGLANDAKVGLANIQRWRGRDDLALPVYREVLAADAANEGASEGQALALRELRPRTTLNAGKFSDSSNVGRKAATATHRYRDGKGPNVIELEVGRVQDSNPTLETKENTFTGRYTANTLALKPTFTLGLSNVEKDRGLYGGARIRVGEHEDIIEAEKINWGVLATNPLAVQGRLSANHIGLQGTRNTSYGSVTGRFDHYDISDGNTIMTGTLRLASNWRPLGNNVKPFAGIEFREAKFFSPSYWSPNEGFGSYYGGLLAEWDSPDSTFYASGQVGERLYGEAGRSWSLSLGGKYWLGNDLSAGFALWSMASRRNNADYRARSANVIMEKLW